MILKTQMQSASDWTNMLVSDLDEKWWTISPEPLKTNINWLVGHILIDKYFHAVVSVVGGEQEFVKKLPLSKYRSLYDRSTDPLESLADKPGKKSLLAHLELLDRHIMDMLDTLDEKKLSEPPAVANPVADTKLDALSFSFTHQMWHNGQVAILKRIITS